MTLRAAVVSLEICAIWILLGSAIALALDAKRMKAKVPYGNYPPGYPLWLLRQVTATRTIVFWPFLCILGFFLGVLAFCKSVAKAFSDEE